MRALNLAVADLTGDGVADLFVAPGRRGPGVVVDGATGQAMLVFIVGRNPGSGALYLNPVDADGDGDADFFLGISGVRL